MTVLFVDDEPNYRLLVRNLLAGSGFQVLLAENGEAALETIQRSRVDIVVSDIYMPVMDGFKLNKALRAIVEFMTLPFLFLSAYDDQHTLEAIKDPRYEGFLRKTAPPNELLEWIKYLTTPPESRPRIMPGSYKQKDEPRGRDGRRGTMTAPIL